MTQTSTSPIITRDEPFTHSVPGSFGEKFEITVLRIDGELVGVEIDGDVNDPCKRCGLGGQYSFNGFDSICYECHGYSHGKQTTEADIVRRYINRQKYAARQQAASEKAAREQREALAAWTAENADVAEALVEHRSVTDEQGYVDFSFVPKDRFLTSLADQAAYKPLSPKQTDAARAAFTKLAERTQARQDANAETVAAGHWGEVGKRDTVIVKVEKVITIDGEWGTSFLVIMTSVEGHSLKNFASGGSAFATDAIEAEKDGEPLKIKATVKKHDTYKDLPQTVVTRCTTLPG